MADIMICLPKERASEIQDALYFLRGQYSVQTVINIDNPNAEPDDVLEWFSARLDEALLCEDDTMTCEDIIDCVEGQLGTNQTFVENLTNVIYGGNVFQIDYNRRSSQITNPPVPTEQNCSLDLLYGRLVGTLEILNQNNVDFFEQLEVNTNLLFELSDLLIGAVPVVGEWVNQIPAAGNYILENFGENYNAAWTDEYRDDLACDLFCRLRDDCGGFSLGLLMTVLSERLLNQFLPPDTDIVDAVEQLVNVVSDMLAGDFDTVNAADFILMFQLQMLNVFGKWSNPDALNQTGRLVAQISALDTPNNDWVVLCEDCASLWYMGYNTGESGYEAYVFSNHGALTGGFFIGIPQGQVLVSGSAGGVNTGWLYTFTPPRTAQEWDFLSEGTLSQSLSLERLDGGVWNTIASIPVVSNGGNGIPNRVTVNEPIFDNETYRIGWSGSGGTSVDYINGYGIRQI